MIIEAGYDLCTLLFDRKLDPGSLRVVLLDGDLRLVAVRTAVASFSGNFDSDTIEAVDSVIPEPDEDDDIADRFRVQFVAVGYEVTNVKGYPEGFDWDRLKVLEEWLSCRGIELLGVQVSDGERWASSGPIYDFASYVMEDLPRILVIRGPHPFGTCGCAACAASQPGKLRIGV